MLGSLITRSAVLGMLMFAAIGWSAADDDDRRPRAALPLVEIIAIVAERYQGEVTAAEVKPGDDDSPLIYELRLLTPAGNVLRLRLDAANGDFLEVDGRGLVEARKPRKAQP